MSVTSFVVFLTAYATAAAMPGPGLAALVARVLGRGLTGVSAYIIGFVVGDLIWFAAATAGLVALAAPMEAAVTIIRYLGAAYLLYLACRMFIAPPAAIETHPPLAPANAFRDFVAGLGLTLGNPKVIVFFVALLPVVIDLDRLTVGAGLVLGAAMAAVLSLILATYAVLAARARTLFQSRRAMRALNIGSGAVMAGAAAMIAAR